MDKNIEAPKTNFTDEGVLAAPRNVFVVPRNRRQGVATTVYLFAEKYFGKPVVEIWDDSERTPEAKAFWAQPSTPFGKKPSR